MSNFEMPSVEVGEVVLWYPDGAFSDGEVPSPAIITGVSERTVSLTVIEKDAVNVSPHDGVRHVRDPQLALVDNRWAGAWELGPMRKQMRTAAARETVATVGSGKA